MEENKQELEVVQTEETKETEQSEIPHVNLIICTPGHSVTKAYLKSLLATVAVLSDRGITWAFSIEYSSHVGDSREITLSGTLQNNLEQNKPFQGQLTYDKLFWIDSDIAWTPEDFLKLYESDKDIISGAYLLATGEVVAYKEILRKPYLFEEIKQETNLMKIQACGFGFLCVKSGVFETLSRPWFQAAMGTWTSAEGKTYTFPIMGEDISWCQRVLNEGFEIWLDPTAKVTHQKSIMLTWEGMMP